MNVSEAVMSRMSARAFLDRPVSRELVEDLLSKARWAPSGGNLQPWHVHVLTGEKLQEFKEVIAKKVPDSPFGEGFEYHVYPPEMKEPYLARRSKCGSDLYTAIGVTRDDRPGRHKQFRKNYQFFDAPVALFFSIDRGMQEGQWADLGMFMQTLMLLAVEAGLHTCAQESWAGWYATISEFVGIPDERMLFCGLALGYMDESAPINNWRTERADLEEFVSWQGF